MGPSMNRRPYKSRNRTPAIITRRGFLWNTAAFVVGLGFGWPLIPSSVHAHERTRPLGDRLKQSEYQSLLRELETRNGFARSDLDRLFSGVRLHPEIPRLFSKPFEEVPYAQYRTTLVTRAIIEKGRKFMNRHRDIFDRVEESYRVDAPVIGAILGIETKFGDRSSGGFRVFDALNTIFAEIPRRRNFARKELIEFLLLCREEHLRPDRVEGSYAGAMGMPQFIPSSYREYAVDFDGDGKRDLWKSEDDVIGSVAHYLSRHGWKQGGTIAVRLSASTDDPVIQTLVNKGLKGTITVADLEKRGISLTSEFHPPVPHDKVSLISLQEKNGEKIAAVFSNFKTILTYNKALNYAMAVSDLADALESRGI